jgi:hypothetical protein
MEYNESLSFDPLFGPYEDRAQKEINSVDFGALSIIRKKELGSLTEEDFSKIGLNRQKDTNFGELYAVENLDHLKRYLTKEDGRYYFRGFQLSLIKEIVSTEELIKEALIEWKLKLK